MTIPREVRARCGIALVTIMGACAGSRAGEPQQPAPVSSVVVPVDAPAGSAPPASVVVAEPAQAAPPPPAASEEQRSGLPMPPPRAVSVAPDKGGILPLMPAQCRERGYVDVAGLLGSDASAVSALLDKLAQLGLNGRATGALKVLRDTGLDPVLALGEVAFCDAPDLLVARLQPSRPTDVLAAFDAALAGFEPKPTIVSWGPMRVLWAPPSDDLVVQVTPTVLLAAEAPTDAQGALSALAGQSGFADAGRALVWIQGREAEVKVTEAARNLTLVATVRGRETAEAGTQAKRAAKVRKELDRIADELAQGPLALLAPKIRAARVTTAGKDVVVRAQLSRTELGQVVQQLGAAKPADLMKLLR